MASTVLPNGIIVPEKFSRDWYADLYHNWQELDNLLGGGTPKDGTLTIQKNGTTVGTFSANQATDETVNIEVPDVNNGTLTIQQNGTTVDTFTANSSSDKTVNIQCVDLTNNQTVGGNKEFTGTTTAHDLVPSATETYNFGSPSYQWNNAYIKSLTINGVACGDILTHNVNEFVGVSGNQTISGVKTFSNGLFVSKSTAGDLVILEDSSINSTNEDENGLPLTGHTNSIKFKGTQYNVVPCTLTGQVFPSGKTTAELRVYKYKDLNKKTMITLAYNYVLDRAEAQFVNCHLTTGENGQYDIGSSSRTWNNCYLANAPIIVSDARAKTQTQDVDDKLLDAWGNVEIKTYKMVSAVEKKGEKARYHTGYLAQDIQAECEKQGVNASDYGLFCYDEWEEQEEESEEIETEKDGKIVKEKRVIQPKREKGNSYALRYEEALVVECKYLRRCIARLTARIEQLEKGNNIK